MIGNINPHALIENHDPVIGCLIAIGYGCAAGKHLCEMRLVVLFSGIHWEPSFVILFSRRSIAEDGRVEKMGLVHCLRIVKNSMAEKARIEMQLPSKDLYHSLYVFLFIFSFLS